MVGRKNEKRGIGIREKESRLSPVFRPRLYRVKGFGPSRGRGREYSNPPHTQRAGVLDHGTPVKGRDELGPLSLVFQKGVDRPATSACS